MLHRLPAPVLVLAVAALGACATATTIDDTTRRLTLEAAEVCGKRVPGVEYRWDGDTFRIKPTRRGAFDDYYRFTECLTAELDRRTPLSRGRVAERSPSYAVVPVMAERGLILVPITLNGTYRSRLIVDTGASMTILSTEAIAAAGVTVPPGAPRLGFRLADGRLVHRPIVRIASLRVGDVTVEDLDVAVSERSGPGDGLLGQNFLGHFRVTLENERGRLVLDTGRPAPPPAVTGIATKVWTAPVSAWAVGDAWRFRWRSPSGDGAYDSRVVRDEVIDGVRHFVLDEGGRKLTLHADTAGLRSEQSVDGRLVARYSPPVGHPWPLRVGATWDIETDVQDDAGRPGRHIFLRCSATEEARLTVPAGTFDTLHVVCQTRTGAVVRETWWAVEPHTWIRERRLLGNGERVEELQSYSVR
jgi:hypothetical protein